jgi:hypothetical protein
VTGSFSRTQLHEVRSLFIASVLVTAQGSGGNWEEITRNNEFTHKLHPLWERECDIVGSPFGGYILVDSIINIFTTSVSRWETQTCLHKRV